MNKIILYKHYKGGIYRVLNIATHTETLERMVIYKGNPTDCNPSGVWVRHIGAFCGYVKHNGISVTRFTRIFIVPKPCNITYPKP